MKPPEFLGPYRIGETLGKGGMGSVFKAKHEKSGEDVAVKLIATQMSDEMRFRRRFHAEIETLKRLSHPNIVKLVGYGEEQGMLFYSMEYVAGETLQSIIRRDKKLPWTTTLDIAIQVCSALKHAHDFGVIHRDLKPANLIVADDGTVKLLDFGISKIFGNDQTAVGSIMGTADYMSPEQANETGITARTDLFSLGCVIYAMLCGKPPFRGKNITEVITALKQKDPIPLELIDPDLPEDLVQIVDELLQKRSEDRPPTALAVMNRLKAMRAGLNRMRTLADKEDKEDNQPGNESKGDTKLKPGKLPSGESADTAAGAPVKPAGDQTQITSNETRSADTLPFAEDVQTGFSVADPSTGTVHTEGRDGNRGTVHRTGFASPVANNNVDVPTDDDDDGDDDGGDDGGGGGDTSAGASGKTHFQTVSDGEVRGGFFETPEPKSEHSRLHLASIAVLSLVLLIGGFFLIQSLRGPTAEQLLAAIEQQVDDDQSFQAQKEIERFLKLYPDHPEADAIRQRQMAYRVEAAVRRLRLKAKLRSTEGPLYEQAFLDAMDLRRNDPAAAREKLSQWIDVFQDSSMDQEDEPLQLAELARFETDRLAETLDEWEGSPGDPKLVELMLRIDNARALPEEERRRLLDGIVTLYEGQPWAEKARLRALEILATETE